MVLGFEDFWLCPAALSDLLWSRGNGIFYFGSGRSFGRCLLVCLVVFRFEVPEFEFCYGDDGIVSFGAEVPCCSGLLPKHWGSVPSPPLYGRCLGRSARAAVESPHYLLVPLSTAASARAACRRLHAPPFGCTARCPLCEPCSSLRHALPWSRSWTTP